MLGKLAIAGKNGQFRTPKHIRDMIVELVQPTPDDFICDPACGTDVLGRAELAVFSCNCQLAQHILEMCIRDRNKVDKIWTDIWAGGITNPLTVIEQLTSHVHPVTGRERACHRRF